jgi:hypothetical protein
MNKPEYSDLYKFLVSLGILLIAFAILLPWLFLRESFDTLVTVSDIANLTSTAQTLIEYRQNTALWFIKNIVWIISIPAAIGLVFFLYGFLLWKRKQKIFDKIDEINLGVAEMSAEQIAVKAIKETVDESQISQGESESIPRAEKQIRAINKYFRIEKMVIERLVDCYGSANVRPNVRVGNTEIDVLVRITQRERAIFEVKSVKKINVAQYQRVVIDVLLQAVNRYNASANKNSTYGIGLLIVNGDDREDSPAEFSKIITDQIIGDIHVKIIAITGSEFSSLGLDDLKALLRKH